MDLYTEVKDYDIQCISCSGVRRTLLISIGVVWAGTSVFPDWFHEDVQDYWTNEFALFFDADDGVDIDALWIDMNEAANFCDWPCLDPDQFSIDNDMPPAPPPIRDPPRPIPGFPPVLQPSRKRSLQNRSPGDKLGLPGRDLINPLYTIENAAGSLSNKTMNTDLVHANGLVQYDTHNLYGSCKIFVPISPVVIFL